MTLVKAKLETRLTVKPAARPVIICSNISRVTAFNWATHWWLLWLY